MQCRVCDSEDLTPVIDLGTQPWGNHFLKKSDVGSEPFYPLRVVYCRNCSTAQLDYTVPKKTMFADHTYLSGVTKSLRTHFDQVADDVIRRFYNEKPIKGARALDIGSNDGTQLKCYQAKGFDVLGVESSKTAAAIANQNGIPTLNRFFNTEALGELGGQFDVINAAGVFFHLEELHSVTEAIREALKGDGVFVVQFLYMKSIIENLAFDQIYHEHLLYYTLKTIETLLSRHGLAMFDAYLSPIHGGSIIGFIGHSGKRPPSPGLIDMRRQEDAASSNHMDTYLKFAKRIEVMKAENLEFLRARKAEGKRIYGMGAPVKGNTLLNYFGIGTNSIDYLVEKNALRNGLYSPGSHIPIIMEDEITDPPDVYYVLAWNFRTEILENNKALLDKGVEFFFPVVPKGSA